MLTDIGLVLVIGRDDVDPPAFASSPESSIAICAATSSRGADILVEAGLIAEAPTLVTLSIVCANALLTTPGLWS